MAVLLGFGWTSPTRQTRLQTQQEEGHCGRRSLHDDLRGERAGASERSRLTQGWAPGLANVPHASVHGAQTTRAGYHSPFAAISTLTPQKSRRLPRKRRRRCVTNWTGSKFAYAFISWWQAWRSVCAPSLAMMLTRVRHTRAGPGVAGRTQGQNCPKPIRKWTHCGLNMRM